MKTRWQQQWDIDAVERLWTEAAECRVEAEMGLAVALECPAERSVRVCSLSFPIEPRRLREEDLLTADVLALEAAGWAREMAGLRRRITEMWDAMK